MQRFFYEKRYFRPDGEVYAKRYSRSFNLGQEVQERDKPQFSNVQEASISRARSKVRLLAFSNPDLTGLLTLTFKDIPTEEEAHRRFDLYRRLVARSYKGWKFLGVKELQQRGSIHYHILVNFCPGIIPSPNNSSKRISDLWSYGFSDFQVIKGDDKWRTELYLLKYLAKDKVKLFTQYYVRSRGLKELEPRYYDNREPLHPLATNLFHTHTGKKGIASMDILEYTYSITNKRGKNLWQK